MFSFHYERAQDKSNRAVRCQQQLDGGDVMWRDVSIAE
jgi:hypothetical protein